MLIDSHCHAGSGDGLTGPWDTNAPLQEYLLRADDAGITRTLLFSVFHSDYAVANAEVARIVASQPNRFLGFAFVHAERDRGRIGRLVATAVRQYGFVGIKVHRHDARLSREVCETARTFRVPILYDPMGEVSVVDVAALAYPNVAFIIAHLGSFADDAFAQQGLIDIMVRRPNVYADTAGVRRFGLLTQAVERVGAHRILFGSDGPWLHPGVELAKIRALRLSAGDEERILGGNLLELIANVKSCQRSDFRRFGRSWTEDCFCARSSWRTPVALETNDATSTQEHPSRPMHLPWLLRAASSTPQRSRGT